MANKIDQSVADIADEVLARQAKARAARTGESFEGALEVVLRTEAGRQLEKLRTGLHRHERAEEWQRNVAWEQPDALGRLPLREASDLSAGG